ncbi:MAG: riboflavin synthase [Phycisphaerales bacterium]|nr:riboflavin synthase [Planctomycetota bacterium]MBL6997745.1 riboflavin synthase [Phycisphaerales bacterium]
MFTGLIETVGVVQGLQEKEFGLHLTIRCPQWSELPEIGASISTLGCCLTVVHASKEQEGIVLAFDVVHESLQCTTLGTLREGDSVNLEQALQSDSRMGGHFVQGHIDCVEHVLKSELLEEGECRIRVSMDDVDRDTVVPKGSITIEGVSLTIAKVDKEWFEVVLIPTTLKETTLGNLAEGDMVNIETDILAKTVVQVVRRMQVN